ncbi:glycosyltransferase family 8 protein [Pelobium manganitolerans]|uniref:glycosyltransferase family 8 protein n=1 Tax=Pelobium manganitolerans TaxID=1842495 RepID=UPI003FA3B2E7
MENNLLNIFFVLDKNYIVPFTVTLTSILENNKDLEIQAFVLHELGHNDTLELACKFFKDKYNLEIASISFEDKYFNDFHIAEHITKAGYFKLLLGQMIPESVSCGLYIDCDIAVTGSLKEFCTLDFYDDAKGEETPLCAVTDVRATKEITRLNKAGANLVSYFNTGVFFANLKKWRADNAAEKMIAIGQQYDKNLVYVDQDVMNVYFKTNYKELNDKYNADAAVKHVQLPVILHYHGISKPWHFVDNSPYKHIYRKYLKMTPFKNVKQQGISLENFARKYVRWFRQKLNPVPDYTI